MALHAVSRVTITSDRIIILLVMKYDYNVKTLHAKGIKEATDNTDNNTQPVSHVCTM